MLGAFTQPVQIHPIMFFIKEPKIVGSNCYGRPGRNSDYEIAIEIMRRNAESLRRCITHRYPLGRHRAGVRDGGRQGAGAIKVQITP